MQIKRIHLDVFRAPVEKPVVTSFGRIPSRAVALLRLEDADGAVGWGDIWGNFPTVTTEYRANLAAFVLPELLLGQTVTDVPGFYRSLVAKLRVLALQADEPGPVASILAATDQALWDLAARKAGQPLRKLLDPNAGDRVPVYASGLNPGDGPETVEAERAAGHRNFKLKIGFGDDVDQRNVRRIVDGLGQGERFFVDANQKWGLEDAIRAAGWLADWGVGWLEEPMPADAPDADWRALKAATRLPLAGAENLRGLDRVKTALEWLDYVQPDVGKWGGVTDCFRIARMALDAGRTYCPHWLAGGVGLAHSANLLAAAGGAGLLEMDVNENPFRDQVLGGALAVREGFVDLPDGPGIGLEPDLEAMARWRISAAILD